MATVNAPHDQAAPWVDGLTIGQVLRETARRHSQRDAVNFCNPPTKLTWGEFDAVVDRAARGLLALGFAPGDHFGVWATNVPAWVILQFATARIGVVLVNMPGPKPIPWSIRALVIAGLVLLGWGLGALADRFLKK